jgi:hypothetical protein
MASTTEFTRAKKAVHARLGFNIHLTAYLVVNVLLLAINIVTSPTHLWFQWPLLGWGLGLAAHAFAAFGLPGLRGRMIENELARQAPRGR